MVQVVGKDQQHIKRTTCYKCASVLEYTLSEVKTKIEIDYTGGRDTVTYVQCPCCGHEVVVM